MDAQQKRDFLMSLPLMEREQQWIMERLDTLSVKEQHQLSAAILRIGKLEELAGKTGWELQTAILHMDPEAAVDGVNCLLSLEDYQVCFPAGSYAQLGSFYLQHEGHLPERAMYYTDLEALGRRYEDRHPGLFVGNCYVEYPEHPSAPRYTGQGIIPEDAGWSVKVKLASSAVPEGVWLRLPDHSLVNDGKPDEVEIALDILDQLDYDAHQQELARIAGFMHDIGNVVNRHDHAISGATMAFRILDNMGMEPADVAAVITAIGHHDDSTAFPVNPVAAALILADKTDVRRSRVRNKEHQSFDIHDRVNYAAERSDLALDRADGTITLTLTINTEFCAVMDYFEIFLERMLLCRRAAEYLGLQFKLVINGLALL